MTKRHFETFAREMRREFEVSKNEDTKAGLAVATDIFARLAQAENPRFDRARFFQACGFIPANHDGR